MPAGPTYNSIQKITTAQTYTSVAFTNIPQTYTDLIIVMVSRNFNSGNNGKMWFNNDTSALYSNTTAYGTGTSTSSSSINNASLSYLPDISAGHNSPTIINIMNYTNTNVQRMFVMQGGASDTNAAIWVGLYRSTNAITRIDLASFGGDWVSGSTFNLYGVTAA